MPARKLIRRSALGAATFASATACVPYTVATTATPLPRGKDASTMVTYAMPKIGRIDSSRHLRETPVSYLAADFEWRMGLDEKSDVGVRVPSMSGLVVNYKRVLGDSSSRFRSAIMPGAGLVNLGQHAHFELTWLVSGREEIGARKAVFVPYGGLRVMQVAPVVEGAVSDRPTIGGFIGSRIGSLDLGVSPEIGVFYDHSALDLRDRDIVIVPAIAVHGDRLINIVRGRPWRGQRRPPGGPGATPPGPATFPALPPQLIPPPTHAIPTPSRMPARVRGRSTAGAPVLAMPIIGTGFSGAVKP